MNNNLIEKMLSSKSKEELDEIIANRITEEKQEYKLAFFKKKIKDLKEKGIDPSNFIYSFAQPNYSHSQYFSPPKNENDLNVYTFEDFLDPDSVTISISNYPVYEYHFDDEHDIYEMLAYKLSEYPNPIDKDSVIEAVSETIFDYVGGAKIQGNDHDRLQILKPSSELDDGESNKISLFRASSKAWCIERSCMAHQLFKFLGLNSKIVMCVISNNGERQIHAFNLLKRDNNAVLFDSAVMGAPINGKYNAVAMTLPIESYDKNLTDITPLEPREIIGQKTGKKYEIIYDLKNHLSYEQENGNQK